MSYWSVVYPDAAEPTTHSTNERNTQQGLHFVTNVVFDSLDQDGVIVISSSSSNYLLVYQTTFIKPYSSKYGGAISFEGANCVQISVCSNEAYATDPGEHSYVVLPTNSKWKNEIVECSVVNTIGKQSIFWALYGILNLSYTNVSHCVGENQAAWRFVCPDSESSFQKFTTNCNISSINSWPVFGYQATSKFDVNDSIFIKNSNKLGNWGIFYARAIVLNLYRCIIVDNIGEKLFSPYDSGSIKVYNCYINNPKCPNEGANYLSTTDPFVLDFSHISLQNCVM